MLAFGAIYVQPICCLHLNYKLLMCFGYMYVNTNMYFAKKTSLLPCQMIAQADFTLAKCFIHIYTHIPTVSSLFFY